jgi:hypothetical protein
MDRQKKIDSLYIALIFPENAAIELLLFLFQGDLALLVLEASEEWGIEQAIYSCLPNFRQWMLEVPEKYDQYIELDRSSWEAVGARLYLEDSTTEKVMRVLCGR